MVVLAMDYAVFEGLRIKNKNQQMGEKNTHFVLEKVVEMMLDVYGSERGVWGW